MLGEEERIKPVDAAFVAAGNMSAENIDGCGLGEDVRLAQIVQGGDALRGHLLDVLEDGMGVGAVAALQGNGRGGAQTATRIHVLRTASLLQIGLCGGRVSHGNGHAGGGVGRLGAVEGS